MGSLRVGEMRTSTAERRLLAAGIISRSGTFYETGTRYTRVSLLKTQDDFDLLLERITDFVDAEKHSRAPVASSSMHVKS
uniref:Alliinase C-terminal domain-containing protein n=1 Tax=Oryza punctata TaxID=4537 RepID=A0A0E0JNA9_ORYPU